MSEMARTKNFAESIRAKMAADPALEASVEEEVINAHIAQQVYDLRKEAGLNQKELAERIGTQQSVISRIEDSDYEGHSLDLLKRIAYALGKKLRIEFYSEPIASASTSAVGEAATHEIASHPSEGIQAEP
jgi:transcriptional regulator with XRE-family HTH domain